MQWIQATGVDRDHPSAMGELQQAQSLGLLRQQGGWRKTDDRLILTGQWNTGMQKALKDARLSVLVDARTQMLPGYALVNGLPDREQRISDFLSPGYVVAAAGIAPKPGPQHKLFAAPFTGKLTILLDDTLSNHQVAHLANVTKVADCLDPEATEWVEVLGRRVHVKTYAFRPEALPDVAVFKVQGLERDRVFMRSRVEPHCLRPGRRQSTPTESGQAGALPFEEFGIRSPMIRACAWQLSSVTQRTALMELGGPG